MFEISWNPYPQTKNATMFFFQTVNLQVLELPVLLIFYCVCSTCELVRFQFLYVNQHMKNSDVLNIIKKILNIKYDSTLNIIFFSLQYVTYGQKTSPTEFTSTRPKATEAIERSGETNELSHMLGE